MRTRWLAVLVLISACTTDVTTGDESASTSGGAGTGEEFGVDPDGEPPAPPAGETPIATDQCVDDEDFIGADGSVHLEPGGCELVDDTSKCCLDTTGTKWVCTGGDEFPGALDVHERAAFPCPGL